MPAPGGCRAGRSVEGGGGVALFGATGTMIGWGMVRGRHAFELTEVPVRIEGLPRVLDGYTIVQVSDIHAGDYVGERELDEGLSLVRAARPDLLVVTGDIVDFDSDRAPLVARKLADVAPRDGVAVILGNHDYYADEDEVSAALRAAGIDLLVDEGRVLRARRTEAASRSSASTTSGRAGTADGGRGSRGRGDGAARPAADPSFSPAADHRRVGRTSRAPAQRSHPRRPDQPWLSPGRSLLEVRLGPIASTARPST